MINGINKQSRQLCECMAGGVFMWVDLWYSSVREPGGAATEAQYSETGSI